MPCLLMSTSIKSHHKIKSIGPSHNPGLNWQIPEHENVATAREQNLTNRASDLKMVIEHSLLEDLVKGFSKQIFGSSYSTMLSLKM